MNRQEAKAAGELFYTDCKPCPNGHTPKRYTSNSCCYECKLVGTGGYAERYRDTSRKRLHRYRRDEVMNAKFKEADKRRRNDPKNKRKYQSASLKTRLGIGLDTADAIFLSQNGKCAICQSDMPFDNLRLRPVDHDHKTGKVRGILCNACNTGLGKFRDSPVLMRCAIDYLVKHSA